MFTKSEQLYDAIYAWKDYAAESRRLLEVIADHKTSDGNTFLDVACGTGAHMPHLSAAFALEGLDLDEGMLSVARAKHPGIPFHQGDMVDFDLGRRFDVVASLFSSVGYLKTPDRLTLAVANMARHVRPGGVLVVEPYFPPDAWKPATNAPPVNLVERPDLSIVRMVEGTRKGNIVTSTFHYLVGTSERVEHFTEVHEMGLFTEAEHRAAFAAAGMSLTHHASGLMGRGLYIGTWPTGR